MKDKRGFELSVGDAVVYGFCDSRKYKNNIPRRASSIGIGKLVKLTVTQAGNNICKIKPYKEDEIISIYAYNVMRLDALAVFHDQIIAES